MPNEIDKTAGYENNPYTVVSYTTSKRLEVIDSMGDVVIEYLCGKGGKGKIYKSDYNVVKSAMEALDKYFIEFPAPIILGYDSFEP